MYNDGVSAGFQAAAAGARVCRWRAVTKRGAEAAAAPEEDSGQPEEDAANRGPQPEQRGGRQRAAQRLRLHPGGAARQEQGPGEQAGEGELTLELMKMKLPE